MVRWTAKSRNVIMIAVIILTAAWCLARYAKTSNPDCITQCLALRQCDLDFSKPHQVGPDCLNAQNQCYTQCVAQGKAPKSLPAVYGALAYDKATTAWGVADRSTDKGAAELSALNYCARNSKQCKIAESFQDSCIAVARDGATTVSWGIDKDKAKAKAKAKAKCEKEAKTACTADYANCYLP